MNRKKDDAATWGFFNLGKPLFACPEILLAATWRFLMCMSKNIVSRHHLKRGFFWSSLPTSSTVRLTPPPCSHGSTLTVAQSKFLAETEIEYVRKVEQVICKVPSTLESQVPGHQWCQHGEEPGNIKFGDVDWVFEWRVFCDRHSRAALCTRGSALKNHSYNSISIF